MDGTRPQDRGAASYPEVLGAVYDFDDGVLRLQLVVCESPHTRGRLVEVCERLSIGWSTSPPEYAPEYLLTPLAEWQHTERGMLEREASRPLQSRPETSRQPEPGCTEESHDKARADHAVWSTLPNARLARFGWGQVHEWRDCPHCGETFAIELVEANVPNLEPDFGPRLERKGGTFKL